MRQVEDTHRPRTSAWLPGGRLRDVYAGHQGASRRKAARPDDTTRTPRHRGPGPGRAVDVACAAWAKVGMATNPSAVMLVDPRKGGNKHRHANGGDSTGRDGVCNHHRSVGGCPRLPDFRSDGAGLVQGLSGGRSGGPVVSLRHVPTCPGRRHRCHLLHRVESRRFRLSLWSYGAGSGSGLVRSGVCISYPCV